MITAASFFDDDNDEFTLYETDSICNPECEEESFEHELEHGAKNYLLNAGYFFAVNAIEDDKEFRARNQVLAAACLALVGLHNEFVHTVFGLPWLGEH